METPNPTPEEDFAVYEETDPRFAKQCHAMIIQTCRDVEELLNEAERRWSQCPPELETAPFMQDLMATENDEFLQAPYEDALQQFQLLMTSARDYTESITLLLKHDHFMVQPAWALLRGLMEAVLMSAWLIDTRVSSEMRLTRMVALLPAIGQDSRKAAANFTVGADEIEARKASFAKVIDYYQRNGVVFKWKLTQAKKPTDVINSLTHRGNEVNLSWNKTDLARAYLPKGNYLYPLLSGASHSEFWMLNSMDTIKAGDTLRGLMIPLFQIGICYVESLCSYFAIESNAVMIRYRRRMTAIVDERSWVRTERQTAFGTIISTRPFNPATDG